MKNKKSIEHITEYQKYNSKSPFVKLVIKKFMKDLFFQIKLCKISDSHKILDVGCGDGFILKELIKRKTNSFTVGLDVSPNTLKFSRKLNPSARLIQADIYSLPFKENLFDLVINLQVLEHLEKPKKAIDELRRVTKRYCIIGVPYEPFFRMANIVRLKYLFNLGNYPDHINHWNKALLRRLLKKFFKRVRIKSSSIWLIALCEK